MPTTVAAMITAAAIRVGQPKADSMINGSDQVRLPHDGDQDAEDVAGAVGCAEQLGEPELVPLRIARSDLGQPADDVGQTDEAPADGGAGLAAGGPTAAVGRLDRDLSSRPGSASPRGAGRARFDPTRRPR